MSTYPRPNIPPHETRAWLSEAEAGVLDAFESPDILASLSINVVLAEHQGRAANGKRKRVKRASFTPEQHDRETKAGALLNHRMTGYRAVGALLQSLATNRCLLHHALAGTEPPEGLAFPSLVTKDERRPAAKAGGAG